MKAKIKHKEAVAAGMLPEKDFTIFADQISFHLDADQIQINHSSHFIGHKMVYYSTFDYWSPLKAWN